MQIQQFEQGPLVALKDMASGQVFFGFDGVTLCMKLQGIAPGSIVRLEDGQTDVVAETDLFNLCDCVLGPA